jgi:hypothetical protein
MQNFLLGTLFLGCLVGLGALAFFAVMALTGAGIERLSKK